MELSKEEIRLLLHFQYKLGVNASEARRRFTVTKFAMFVQLNVGSRHFMRKDNDCPKIKERDVYDKSNAEQSSIKLKKIHR
ncbi:hypothetical protein KIN20_005225 [Parelaphostrongylus tenuis]|uniref:Uncharacterized protein n=1 Tax=Parelaphostrongylus tenuis TaxID=148309 RepID=A0AAD5QIF6_PARTN|nr:hypothetical protein KIN20_005225 [Parelaphostrongylus tenuis]